MGPGVGVPRARCMTDDSVINAEAVGCREWMGRSFVIVGTRSQRDEQWTDR